MEEHIKDSLSIEQMKLEHRKTIALERQAEAMDIMIMKIENLSTELARLVRFQ